MFWFTSKTTLIIMAAGIGSRYKGLKQIDPVGPNGELVVEEGVLLTVDEEKLVQQVQRTTEAIWNRIPENHYLGQGSDEVSSQCFKPWEP